MNRLFSFSIATLCFGFAVFARFPADAQEGGASEDTKKAIYMPPGQSKIYEGYFQFSQSNDQVI
jgi:hypothetical protein